MIDGIVLLMGRGEAATALHFARFAFGIDNLREDVCFYFMELQRQAGQYASAIATFLNCRRGLIETFGIEGPKRLDDLYNRIITEMERETDVASKPSRAS